MNIKVAAFTVSEKSSNTDPHFQRKMFQECYLVNTYEVLP